jgi:oxalate---CoA ligase
VAHLLDLLLPSCAPALLSPAGGPAFPYASLHSLAAATAALLRARGIGPADRVAILTPNGPEAAIAFLSIAASAAAAPLNPAYTARELEFYLNDLRPKALLLSQGFDSPATAIAHRSGIDVLFLHPATGVISAPGPSSAPPLPDTPSAPDDTALLLHTSGTTSRPKLVPLSHRNLCASARNIARTLQLAPADRCLNIMPLFHIHGLVGAVLSSLAAGASVICTPGLDVKLFPEWLATGAPTWYTAVPTMHQTILARCTSGPHRLRLIRSSSSALPPSVMAALEERFGVPVLESYGMTEAAHQMASNPLPPAIRKPGSVGPAAGPEIRIINGEVCIRGENVTAGYADNPDANADAFRDGWFRTGDQGFLDDDGYLHLTGRIKELINRGGEKISPREIDEALLAHPAIQQAVAFAIPHSRLGEEIGIAIVPRAGTAITPNEIIEFAAARLADFKVPAVVRIVEEIPKGPTGKLQRIGLASALGVEPISELRPDRTATGVAPRNDDERALHGIWADVLNRTDFGVEDEFSSLGGDSLAVAQIAALIPDRLGIALPLVAFRTTPTIAGMAQVIDRLRQAGHSGIAPGLVAVRTDGSGPPLYCVAGHSGLLRGFALLSLRLNRPVYAFEPPAAGLETIPALAARYLLVLRTQQPTGPYHLLGQCFGGFVAYEMACQLAEIGEEVQLLTLLECFQPLGLQRLSAAARAAIRARYLLRRVAYHVARAVREPSPIAYLRFRAAAVRDEGREQDAQARYEACILAGRPLPAEQFIANRVAAARYQPRPYRGAVQLIASAAPHARFLPVPAMGWYGLLLGPVSEVRVDDRLNGLLTEPYSVQVAAALEP